MLWRNKISAEKGTKDTSKCSTQALDPIYARSGTGCSRAIQGLIRDFQKMTSLTQFNLSFIIFTTFMCL